MGDSKPVRSSVTLTGSSAEFLNLMAERHGVSKSQIATYGLALMALAESLEEGSKLVKQDSDGNTEPVGLPWKNDSDTVK